jgi:hypothetical protein
MFKSLFLAFFLSLIIAGCSSSGKEKRLPEPSVFYEIFPALIDTLHYERRAALYEVTNDTFRLDSLARDTTSIVIAIIDTLQYLKKDDYLRLQNHLNSSSKELDSLNEDSLRILDIAKLKASDKRIIFKPISAFPTGLAFWKTDYNFYLSARFSFSNILFNKDKSRGLLHVGYVCGPYKCGEGFLVYLKKEKDRWVIDKIEDTWAI